ncbi:MAG: hypothetical protein V1813_01710 [Candidatus Aenigmatarchaeota archaeon]
MMLTLKERQKRPDKKKALSILSAARRDMEFTLGIKPDKGSASTIIRNIYECFRMLGEALLVSRGIEPRDHVLPIRELMKLPVSTSRPVSLIETLRKLRHGVNYYGYSPSMLEVGDALSIAESCFEPLYRAVYAEVKK